MQSVNGVALPVCQAAGPIRPTALYEGIADSVRERILAHQLPPGSPIDEVALARHYGVSRTPVREAIKVLVNEGLLRMTPYQGCCVAEIGREDLHELLDVIELLDKHALRQLARRPEKAELLRLFEAYERRAAAPPGQAGAVWSSFCCQVGEVLGSTPFAAVSRNLQQQLRLGLGPRLDELDRGAPPEHRAKLLQALLDGDLASLNNCLPLHLEIFRSAVLAAGGLPVGSPQITYLK